MHRTLRLLRGAAAASVVLTIAACSSSSSSGPAPASLPPGVSTLSLTMSTTVPASSETHTCQYLRLPASFGAQSFVVGGTHTYTQGSHHMILFRTDLAEIPAGQDAPQDCYEGPNGSVMGHIRGIIYAAQTPTADTTYPTGVGLPLTNQEVFLMQTHYQNPGDKPVDAKVDLTLRISDGTSVSTRAGVFFFYDPFIDVPAGVKGARASMRCLVKNDVTLVSASSHYHKRGYDYAAYLDPASGPLATTPFYTSSDWDHPKPLATTMPIAAGSRIRFNCGYDNTGGTKEYFQGQSANDDEMCMFIGVYYPEIGQADDFCRADPDMFGTGTQGCSPTLACLRACPPPAASTGPFYVDTCTQKCLVASCPDATPKVIAVNDCAKQKCATECADRTSAACTTCSATNCTDAVSACSANTCQ